MCVLDASLYISWKIFHEKFKRPIPFKIQVDARSVSLFSTEKPENGIFFWKYLQDMQ